MTPDQARALLDGTTPGPWHVDPLHSGEVLSPENHWLAGTYETEGQFTADELARAQADTRLIAAAPTLAAMIAGMRPEYRAEYQAAGGRWFPVPHCCNCGGEEWGTKEQAERNAAAWKADDYAVRVVRRYVTEPEATDATD